MLVEGFPEFDYPFVDYDVPKDPWVDAVLGKTSSRMSIATWGVWILRPRTDG